MQRLSIPKKIFFALLLVAALSAAALLIIERAEQTPQDAVPHSSFGQPTNFVEVGTSYTNYATDGDYTPRFVYTGETGTTSVVLNLGIDSVCMTRENAVPCAAMSQTFDAAFGEKEVLVEGVLEGETLDVRKIRAARDGEQLRTYEPGNVFIPWYEAVALLETCDVALLTQTHALDVYLTLENGAKVRTVEPTIDEVFRVVERTRPTCGTFPVATE